MFKFVRVVSKRVEFFELVQVDANSRRSGGLTFALLFDKTAEHCARRKVRLERDATVTLQNGTQRGADDGGRAFVLFVKVAQRRKMSVVVVLLPLLFTFGLQRVFGTESRKFKAKRLFDFQFAANLFQKGLGVRRDDKLAALALQSGDMLRRRAHAMFVQARERVVENDDRVFQIRIVFQRREKVRQRQRSAVARA